MSPVLAPTGPERAARRGLLLVVERTCRAAGQTSRFDPLRKSPKAVADFSNMFVAKWLPPVDLALRRSSATAANTGKHHDHTTGIRHGSNQRHSAARGACRKGAAGRAGPRLAGELVLMAASDPGAY